MKNYLQNSLTKIKQALFKTREGVASYVPKEEACVDIDENIYDALLERFIKADIGVDLSERIIINLKGRIKEHKVERSKLQNALRDVVKSFVRIEASSYCVQFDPTRLNVYVVVGVNGSGKTTSIGKLAKRFKDQGAKVLIVAADTFRAAANDQLLVWAKRAGVEIFMQDSVKKPDAVVFAGLEKGKKENYNLLLVDTAGRLHSQLNLMEELKKINSVIKKNAAASVIEKLIVLDATVGQNAINQVELFNKWIGLTGIFLAKLDSSSKGGVVLNIMDKNSLPVKLIGTGENIDDIVDFNFDEYLNGLLS